MFQVLVLPGQIVFIDQIPDIVEAVPHDGLPFPQGQAFLEMHMDQKEMTDPAPSPRSGMITMGAPSDFPLPI